MIRALRLAACLPLLALAPHVANAASWSSLDVKGEEVRIYRDDFGRPHIFGATNQGVFTAYGYALAEDRLWQLELNRRAARGRLAEAFGCPPAPATCLNLLSDTLVRTTGYSQAELEAQFAALDPADQAIYQAYVDGINRFIAFALENPLARMPFELLAVGITPAPWTVSDAVAFGAFMARRFGEIGGSELANKTLLDALLARHGAAGVGIFNDVRWLVDTDSPATVPDSGAFGRRHHGARPHDAQLRALGNAPARPDEDVRRHWEALGVPSRLGSYAWVVSPNKSAHGYAMLYGGPQMGFSVPEIVHEVQLKSDEGFNVTGMSVAGMPFVLIGRNRHVAWSFTTGLASDNVDTYVETLCAGGTIFNGACRPFEARREQIQVRGAAPVTIDILRTVHGPVVGTSGGLAFTQKRAHWMTEVASVTRAGAMGRAQNLEQFERAVRSVTVAFNVFYADHRGNIAYWLAGLHPVRPAGFDPRLPLPGDGTAEWTGSFVPVPSSVNPQRGWLASWNNRPTRDYPGNEASFGAIHRANDLFARFEASRISLDDMRDIPKDIARVKGELGRDSRFLLPYLLGALNAHPPADAVGQAARSVLQGWDGSAISDALTSTSRQAGEVIFTAWLDRALRNTFEDELGAALMPQASSNMLLHALDQALGDGSAVPPSRDYFNGAPPRSVLATSFNEAVAALAGSQGSNPAAWTAPRGSITFSHPVLGTVAQIPLSNRSTYGQIVQLKPRLEAENIFTLGQSGHIGVGPGFSPVFDAHFFDQLPLYGRFEYKPMPLYLDDTLTQ